MFMDLELAKRLERAEGSICASYVEPRNAYEPVGAATREFAGTIAVFDGIESPLTQTFGLGVFAPAGDAELATIEAFFTERRAPTMHEVSPFAGVATMSALVGRGYQPIELSSVLVQPVGEVRVTAALRARVIDPARDGATWVDTAVAGWSSDPAHEPLMRTIAQVNLLNPAIRQFLVEHDGKPIASAALAMHEGVALLAGASTVPAARGLGAQAALLAARLAYAHDHGCTAAMMVASVGSTSQRNAERSGFRVAYTRTKWRRELA